MAGHDDLPVQPGLSIPAEELDVTVSRSSGPGGQHVNTTDSRVQLRWNVLESQALTEVQREMLARKLAARLTRDGSVIVACETHRSQHRNREEARERLAALVRDGLHRPKARRKTRPTRGSREDRLKGKRQRSEIKKRRQRPQED